MPGAPAQLDACACARCGYALATPRPDAACPECGLPAAESLHRSEVGGMARLRLVRLAAAVWIVAVVAWAVLLAVPMLGLRWLRVDGLGASTWVVAGAMIVHGLAQAAAMAGCMCAVARRPGRARRAVAALGALLVVAAWVPMTVALTRSTRIDAVEMLGTMLADWTSAALVVGAWVRMQREFLVDTSRGWGALSVMAWAAAATLVAAVPLEWAGVPLSRGMFAPIRWASGMHLLAIAGSAVAAWRCVRAVAPGLVRARFAARGLVRDFEHRFASIRRDSERAIGQLDAERLRRCLDGEVNSVAVIMKHLGGNLRSRFTDFLSTDGEKAWRDREGEFIDDFAPGAAGRDAALAAWTEGWQALESTLATLVDVDLRRTVRIRGEPHTVAQALARSLAHAAYHQGQITLIARMLVGAADWKPISIPRGGTAAHHEAMGFSARRP